MNTIDILIKILWVQGGTIHELEKDLYNATPEKQNEFLNTARKNIFDITDYDTCKKIMEKIKVSLDDWNRKISIPSLD